MGCQRQHTVRTGVVVTWVATLLCVSALSGTGCRRETSVPADDRQGESKSSAAYRIPEDIYGNWKVAAVAGIARISALDEKGAAEWIGATAQYSADSAMFNGPDGLDICSAPTYSRREMTPAEFYDSFRDEAEDLGLKSKSIVLVEIGDASGAWTAPGSCLILRPDGTLVTLWDGAYFELQRTAEAAWTTAIVNSCSDCVQRQVELQSGVKVVCQRTEIGCYKATLRFGEGRLMLDISRDAGFAGFSSARGVVCVHHRFVSNEDELILVRFGPRVDQVNIGHPDSGTYGHLHYEMLGEEGTTLWVREFQYAGDSPPRSRTVTISLAEDLGKVRPGAWAADKE